MATSRYLRANEVNLCFVLIIDRDEKTAGTVDRSHLPRLRWHGIAEGQAANGTGPQSLSAEMRGMSRQRPNAEASRKVSWIDPRRPSVRASPPTFATDKAVRRDTVIGKRISGPLACSARRITDLRRLFRLDLAITMMTHRCRVLRKIRCGDGESRIVGVGGRTLPHGPRKAPESYAPGFLFCPRC